MIRPASHIRVLHIDSGQEWQSVRDQVSLLVNGLRFEPDIRQAVATLESSRLASECEALGVPVIPLPWTVGSDPRALQVLAQFVRGGWHLFHAHDGTALMMMLYIQALDGSNTPLIAARRYSSVPGSSLRWRRSDLVLASSPSARRGLLAAGVEPQRVVVVPNGVDADAEVVEERGVLRAAIGAFPEHRLVGSFTALTRNRDHATLLKAAKLTEESCPDARFAVLGRGPLRPWMEEVIARLELDGRVCLPGYLPDARRYMGDLDAFVMPSYDEELTSACLEAMAAGVPVLMPTTDPTPVAPHDEGPVRIPAGDPEALAGALTRLLNDAEHRAAVAERGRTYVRRFGPAALVSRTAEAYRRIARRDRTG